MTADARRAVRLRPVIVALLLGVAGGLVSGLFGVGGGLITVPLLVMVLGLAQHKAHATSLAAVSIMAAAGAVVFVLGDATVPLASLAIAVGGVAGAFVGSAVMHRLSDARLGQAFAGLLVVVAVWMLANPGVGGTSLIADVGPAVDVGAYGLTGVVAGVTSAVFGVGGGVIIVPVLALLLGFTQHAAEGTSLLAIVPISLAGALRQRRHGYTDWRLGVTVGLAGAAAGVVGASLALQLPEVVLQRLFAVLLAVSGARLLVLKIRARRGAAAPEDAAG